MFEKIIKKLKFGSCKTNVTDDVNAFKNSEKKQEDSTKWNIIVAIANLVGKATQTLFKRCLFMKKLMSKIKWKNKMKYSCSQCDFKWDGTSHTFDKVREHKKTHLENNELKRLRTNNF